MSLSKNRILHKPSVVMFFPFPLFFFSRAYRKNSAPSSDTPKYGGDVKFFSRLNWRYLNIFTNFNGNPTAKMLGRLIWIDDQGIW